MKFIRTPLILAAVLLVLGGLATWDEWQTKKEQKEKDEAHKLTAIEAAQVRKITLVDRSKQEDGKTTQTETQAKRVALEQVDEVWRVIAPLETAADQREVQDFIRTVLDYKYEEIVVEAVTAEVKLEDFGLSEPQRVITLQVEDGGSYELRLGNNAPVGYSTYFQVGGARKRQTSPTSEASGREQIYLGSQYVLNSTQKGLFNFRDKQLLALDAEKVTGVTFWHRESQAYEVARKDGKFQLVRPEPFKTAQRKVSEYIDAFDQVRVEKFIDEPEEALVKKFKTASKIVMSAVFEFNSGESKELTFVRDKGELLGAFAADKIVFGLPASFEEKVRDLSENFRDHSIFTFASAEVKEVNVDGQSYQRVNNDWYRNDDLDAEGNLPEENKPAPNDSVDLLLDSLETAEAIEFAQREQVSKILAQPPARRVVLRIEREGKGESEKGKDKPVERQKIEIAFYVHAKHEDQYYITHTSSDEVYVAARSLLESYTVADEKSKESAFSDSLPNPQGG